MRFCATKCYYSRAYIYVGPVRIAFARFCTVCPCQPRSFDWFAQPVGFQTKGLEQAPGIPAQPAQCLKTFFSSVFARSGSGNSNLSVIKVFFCAKRGLLQASSETRRPSKNSFSKEASRGSWASEAPQSRPAALQPPACPVSSVAAALRRRQRQLQQGLAALRAADGHGVHGPQLLHVAVLRVEAPRRVRRRSEGAHVLHRLHAPVGEVLVVLELVGVVSELCGRLLLHVLGRAVHRLVGPRVVGPGRPLKVVAPLPALARHPRGPGPPRPFLGPLRPVHSFGQLPVQRGELVAQVCRDHKVAVVPRQHAARLVARPTISAFLFCRGSTAAFRVKTSITTRPYFVFPRVFWLKSMRSFGPSAADLPSAHGRGACTCRPTSAFSASKAMACITSRSRCLASRYSFRGSRTSQRLHLKKTAPGCREA